MKYIIDIPNADVSRWIGLTPLGKKLYVPISVEDGKEYLIATEIYAEEYTEPDRNAIDLQHAHDIENVARMNYSKGTEDSWELARRIICPSDCCEDSISAYTKEIFNKDRWEIRGIFKDLSYQEAKAKYEEWLKRKDEIHVGDELKQITASGSPTGAKCIVVKIDGDKMNGIKKDGSLVVCSSQVKRWWTKTGRHFPEVAELLKKMREE